MSDLPPRRYPIRPEPEDDERFTLGLILDIARVLEAAGYPPLGPLDFVDLQQAVYATYIENMGNKHGRWNRRQVRP